MDESKTAKQPKKRKTINYQTKIDIIKKYESGVKLSVIGRSLGLSRSTINTIVKDKEKIKMHIKDGINLQQISATRARSLVMEEMERRLKIWLDDQNQNNIPLTLPVIQKKAKLIHTDLINTTGQNSTDSETFNASWGWFRRFRVRANLNNINVTEEAATADKNAAKEFSVKLKAIIEEGGYLPQQIFNVDETSLFWKKIPTNTFSFEERHTLTLLLGGNAFGDFKLKPMLIYHNENPIALKDISKTSLPVIWRSNQTASMTLALFEDWFHNYFVPSVQSYCIEKNLDFKALLVIDNAQSHYFTLDTYSTIKVVYLPSNTSMLIQPMEQSIIATLKKNYLASIIKSIDEQKVSVDDFWNEYNIFSAIKNIVSCWDKIKETTMNASWKNLCPQYVLKTENFEENQNKIIEEIIEMSQRLELNMDIEDVNDLLESHLEELTTNDLIQTEIKTEIGDESIMPEMELKNISEILSKVEDVIELVENSDPDLERRLNVIQSLRYSTECYQHLYQVKKES